MKVLALSAVVAAFSVSSVHADPTQRAALPGFNGVAFGSTFATAKKHLGVGAKAVKDPSDPKIKILLTNAKLYGESFSINYTFANDHHFSAAYAVARLPAGDLGACQTRWVRVLAGVEAEWGKPDANLNKLSAAVPMQQVTYAFADGSELQAQLLGCLLTLDYLSPGAAG